jgi:hypothetical protein
MNMMRRLVQLTVTGRADDAFVDSEAVSDMLPENSSKVAGS